MSAIIHDVAYDHFGHRVATCSSDHMIRVYDAASGNKIAEWRAHSGSIWRLSWAHPEFGVALASCSFDRRVCVWEENLDAEEVALALAADASGAGAQAGGAGAKAAPSHWALRKEFSDARDSVVDVQFAPHHFGQLLLASCGADGNVRIYEAPDVLDLHTWELHSEFDASAAAVQSAAEISVAAGGGAGGAEGFAMCGASGNSAVLLAPAASTPAPSSAPGVLGVSGAGGGASGADGSGSGGSGSPEPLCLAWGTSIVEAPMLVVGMSDGCVLVRAERLADATLAHAHDPLSLSLPLSAFLSPSLSRLLHSFLPPRCRTQLWIFDEARKQWQRSRAFAPSRCHADCVRSVSWAADMGRSYQLIATASRDRTVKLWALQRHGGLEQSASGENGGGAGGGGSGGSEQGAWSAPCCAELIHRSQVWRVQWNASGSMLATSEDDGSVQCFRQDANGSWRHAEPMRLPA